LSDSFQTLIARTSSLPMTKLSSCGLLPDCASGCAAEAAIVATGNPRVALLWVATCPSREPERTVKRSPDLIRRVALPFKTNPVEVLSESEQDATMRDVNW